MWNTVEKPSMRFSNKGSSASGVTSRPVKPVPPVVMTTSTTGSSIHAFTRARIAFTSSGTIARSASACPAASIRPTRVAPDLSSPSARVSDTVSTAIFNGTNGFVSSMPAMTPCHDLQVRGRKRVAAVDRAVLKAGVEPAHALLGRAVGEAVGHHHAARLALQAIVADRRGGLERGVDVAGFEERLLLLLAVRPYAGEAVGLQLDAHLHAVRLGLRHGVLLLLHCGQDAQQVLHVMPVFVRDHVGLREFARAA